MSADSKTTDNPTVQVGDRVEVQIKAGSRWRLATVARVGNGWVRVTVDKPTKTQPHGVYSRWRAPKTD